MNWFLKITRKFVGRPMPPSSKFPTTVRFRTKKKRMSAGLRDIASIADTAFSTRGLDPQQIESISRIRDTAHYCLGYQVGSAVRVQATPQIEHGECLEENESIMRKSFGKHKLKDNIAHSYGASKDHRSQSCVIITDDDQLQLYNSDGEVDYLQIELGKKVRKKQRVRRKPIGKCKSDSKQCHATIKDKQSQFCNTADKVDKMQFCCSEIGHSELQHADSPINDSQLYHANVQHCPSDRKVDQSLPCQAADELCLAANRVRKAEHVQFGLADRKGDISEPC